MSRSICRRISKDLDELISEIYKNLGPTGVAESRVEATEIFANKVKRNKKIKKEILGD